MHWPTITADGGWPVGLSVLGATAYATIWLLNELRLQWSPRRRNRERNKPGAAARHNERLKLTATFMNGLGIAIMFATVIAPTLHRISGQAEAAPSSQALIGILAAFSCHLLGLWVLRFWREG